MYERIIVAAILTVFVASCIYFSFYSIQLLLGFYNICNFHNQTFKFEPEFIFGASTSAYQIEGATHLDGKGPNIWDKFLHEHPELIIDRSNADVAADSYHLYKNDVAALKRVGFNFYRFSIAWSRILPDGTLDSLNPKGIEYYNNLIDELLSYGIEPIPTMYHVDLPQALQDLGGWTNEIIVQYFEDYAGVLFEHFGAKVKRWLTINEPFDQCVDGYGRGTLAPFIKRPGVGEYLCGQNMLLSHAAAYRLYYEKYSHFGGRVGVTLNSRYFYPKDGQSVELTERGMQYMIGWFAHPIFSSKGGYPPLMEQEIRENSLKEGLTMSRLPFISGQKKALLKGAADFLSFNYYTSNLVELNPRYMHLSSSWEKDSRLLLSYDKKNWTPSKTSWVYSVPQGLGDALRWIKKEYGDLEILITENGWSDNGDILDDERIFYLMRHLQELARAKKCDRLNVVGYGIWSLLDNFEWIGGYTEHFGIYNVNFSSPHKERTPKKSASYLNQVIQSRKIPPSNDVFQK